MHPIIRNLMLLAIVASAWSGEAALSDKAKTLVGTLDKAIDASTTMNDATKKLAKELLLPQSTNAALVGEAKKQNALKVTMEEINKIDAAWQKAESELLIQKEKLNNACAQEIRRITQGHPELVEVFAMDDQGANVGQNALTSDYLQGDEPKWQNSFNKGQGGLDAPAAKLDKSSNIRLQQISLPLIDADGTVVGAVTWGVNIAALK